MLGGRPIQEMTPILDVCCGPRQFWFNKTNQNCLFVDAREFPKQVIWERGADKKSIEVAPDKVMDFRSLDLPDSEFYLVVFDPPHIFQRGGKPGFIQLKYGGLDRDHWQSDLSAGFRECFRVLRPFGTLIFKWSEAEIPLRDVLACCPIPPLFGHHSGKKSLTHWIAFMKGII